MRYRRSQCYGGLSACCAGMQFTARPLVVYEKTDKPLTPKKYTVLNGNLFYVWFAWLFQEHHTSVKQDLPVHGEGQNLALQVRFNGIHHIVFNQLYNYILLHPTLLKSVVWNSVCLFNGTFQSISVIITHFLQNLKNKVKYYYLWDFSNIIRYILQ